LEGPRVRACTGHCFSFERSPSLRQAHVHLFYLHGHRIASLLREALR